MSVGNFSRKLLLVLALSSLVCGILIWRATVRERTRAAMFLHDFVEINVGTNEYGATQQLFTNYADARQSEERYLGTNSGRGGCDQGQCNSAFLFENGWLRRLRLAPPIWIRASVFVDKGTVTSKRLQMGCGKGPTFFLVSVNEEVPGPSAGARAYSVNHRRSDDTDWRISVDLTPQASRVERESAYAINVERLTGFGKCKSATDLLSPAGMTLATARR